MNQVHTTDRQSSFQRRPESTASVDLRIMTTHAKRQATFETAGIDFVEADPIVQISGHRIPTGLRLTVEPEVSQITGFVEDAPRIQRQRLKADAMVQSGDWVVLAGLDGFVDRRSTSWPNRTATEREASSVLVLLNALRVGHGGARRGVAPGEQRSKDRMNDELGQQ